MPPTCSLQIAGRTVVVSEGGPPDAEFALFASGDAQLEKSDVGVVREMGYRTTAAKALELLAERGITLELAANATHAMRPLAETYARGATCRSLAQHMGALELFDGKRYDVKAKRYDGVFLDLPALADDLDLRGGAATLQAIFLHEALREVEPEALVFLTTAELTRDKRPGARSHRRVQLDAATKLVATLERLAKKDRKTTPAREAGPSRVELAESLRLRAAHASATTRERLAAMMKLQQRREQPTKGPLATADVWALEEQLSRDDVAGIAEKIDHLEQIGGRTPTTTYLRARLSLMTGAEDPRVIAERASALVMSMSSFSELELLAAQAWTAAGEPKRALAYAKDLIDSSTVDEYLREKARDVLRVPANTLKLRKSSTSTKAQPGAGRESSPPPRASSPPAESVGPPSHPTVQQPRASAQPPRPSGAARTSAAPRPAARTSAPPRASDPPPADAEPLKPQPILSIGVPAPDRPSTRRIAAANKKGDGSSRPPAARPTARPTPTPRAAAARAQAIDSARRADEHSSRPPKSREPSADPHDVRIAPQRHPPSELFADVAEPSHASGASSAPESPQRRPSAIKDLVETRTKSSFPDPREEPDSARLPPSRPPSQRPPPLLEEEPQPTSQGPFMRGVTQPAFLTDLAPPSVRPVLPRPPPGAPAELAETLTLPPGLHGQAVQLDVLPRSMLDARIQFTHLSRELGREYRKRYRVELRADASGIEAMQRHLHEAFPEHAIQTPEEALEVRRHGAFLSEILARSLGAEWVDIGPTELGYWAMMVPPGTRIWPFARIIRLIAMGHKERDLVSYYLELQARARAT